jgi:Apea-like HEPN
MKAGDASALAVSLDRVNRAMIPISVVDSAIDLGIAPESFFMSDRQSSNQEISFTLKVRAARLVANSFNSRTEISALIQDLYKMRSQAVHSGRFSQVADLMSAG